MHRVVGYTLDVVNDRRQKDKFIVGSPHDWQRGCPNIIRGLRAFPFWDTDEFPWIKKLEAACSGICSELLDLKGQQSFQPYRSPITSTSSSTSTDSLGNLATSSGDWNVCYLQLHGIDIGDNLEKCPVTAAALSHIPRQYRHSFFSALAPSTHVNKHHGPTNKKLRCHLPLKVPKDVRNIKESSSSPSNCWLRVADKTVPIEEGKAIIFDDSFEHEAANNHPDQPRVVLVLDFWHPDFTDEEIKFLDFIGKHQMQTIQKHHKSTELAKDKDRSVQEFNEKMNDDDGRGKCNEGNIQEIKHLTVDEKMKCVEENSSELEAAVMNDDDGKDPDPTAVDALEHESFLTVINRARKAAHMVSEQDIWGSD
eukprot:CAMPEP_0119053306 /NCGR_PEP_ID=MMETSP1177-20130426/74348_1 /TAXON_ID=2985 /ORGANISM="Ochromonas sp, Strain CCMP1899" /LENGTH=365 /DNA_ID=CAMNT_0007033229 /DNA_START=291 /DNA_END=1391 /DNA_ORIENTATION=-